MKIKSESAIDARRIRNTSPLKPLIEAHPTLFGSNEVEDLSMVLFFLHEKLKGEASFYYPAIQIMNTSELPYRWSDEEVGEFQDRVIISYVQLYKAQFYKDLATSLLDLIFRSLRLTLRWCF